MSRSSTPPTGSSSFNSVFTFAPEPESLDEIDRKNRLKILTEAREKNSEVRSKISSDWNKLLNDSFVLGENHSHIAAKRFLVENMQRFREAGYSKIFIEHFGPENEDSISQYQKRGGKDTPDDINEINNSSLENSMLSYTYEFQGFSKKYCTIYDELKQNYNLKVVLREAAKVGIEVVPIEISKENYEKYERGVSRMTYLNSNVVTKIEKELQQNPALKYIVFVGAAHVLNDKYNIDGIAQCLGVQDVVIYDNVVDFPLDTNADFDIESANDSFFDPDASPTRLSESSIPDFKNIEEDKNFDQDIVRSAKVKLGRDDSIYNVFSLKLARHISKDMKLDSIISDINKTSGHEKGIKIKSLSLEESAKTLPKPPFSAGLKNPARPPQRLQVSENSLRK